MVFICSFDPFGEGRYIYTFQNRCEEDRNIILQDDAVKVLVNTKGRFGDISTELKEVLDYLDKEAVTGEFSAELDRAATELKYNEERGQEFMLMSVYFEEAKTAGEYIRLVKQIRDWLSDPDDLTPTKAVKFLGITLPQLKEASELIQQHPDWDDEQIKEEVDWRMWK